MHFNEDSRRRVTSAFQGWREHPRAESLTRPCSWWRGGGGGRYRLNTEPHWPWRFDPRWRGDGWVSKGEKVKRAKGISSSANSRAFLNFPRLILRKVKKSIIRSIFSFSFFHYFPPSNFYEWNSRQRSRHSSVRMSWQLIPFPFRFSTERKRERDVVPFVERDTWNMTWKRPISV